MVKIVKPLSKIGEVHKQIENLDFFSEIQLLNMLKRAVDYRNDQVYTDSDVDHLSKLYRGGQRRTKSIYKGEDKGVVANYILTIIENILSIIKEADLTIKVLPRKGVEALKKTKRKEGEPPEKEGSHYIILADYIKYLLTRTRFKRKFEDFLRWALITGNGFMKVFFDNANEEINLKVVNPKDIFIDPDATDPEDIKYIFERSYRSYDWLKTVFGYHAMRNKLNDRKNWLEKAILMFQRIFGVAEGQEPGDPLKGEVEVFEGWLKKYKTVEKKIDFPEIQKTINYVNLEYDIYKVIIVDDILFSVQKNPYKHKRIPYIVFNDYPLPGSIYGFGECELLETLQKYTHDLKNLKKEYVQTMISGFYITDAKSGIKTDQLKVKPGTIIKLKNPAARFDRINPPPIPANFIQADQENTQTFEYVSGIHKVQQGMVSGRIESGKAINLLKKGTNSRVKAKNDRLEDSLKILCKIIISLIKEFYKKDIYFTHYANKGLINKTETLEIEKVDINTDIEIKIVTDVEGNQDKDFEKALAMVHVQAIPPETLIDLSGIPDLKELIDWAWTQRAARQQQAGEPPPGQEPPVN